jgi:hypothetical protein
MSDLAAPRFGLFLAITAATALLSAGAAAEESSKEAKTAAPAKGAIVEERPEPSPITLDVSAILGEAIRLGGADPFEVSKRTGLLASGGIVFAPMRSFALGFSYEHIDLGADRLIGAGLSSASVEREVHSLWLDLRVHPLRLESLSIFAGLGAGLSFQLAHADRVEDPEGTGRTARLFLCEASGSASIALRGGAGVEVPLGAGFLFVGDVWLENARLSGELLDDCIGGAGTTTILTFRGGIAYRFDVAKLFVNR